MPGSSERQRSATGLPQIIIQIGMMPMIKIGTSLPASVIDIANSQ